MRPKRIPFSDIWHQLHYEDEKERAKGEKRYQNADTSIPGILSPVKNPDNKPYRMIDGRRRMWKLQDQQKDSGLFYVLPEELLMEFFWMIISYSELKKALRTESRILMNPLTTDGPKAAS